MTEICLDTSVLQCYHCWVQSVVFSEPQMMMNMMKMISLIPMLTTLGFLIQESSAGVVTQSPTVKSVSLGETVYLSCTASKGVDDDLSWYLQKPGQSPQLLFYKISQRQSETPGHFSSSGSEPDFTLTISVVQAEDVGDYYCMGSYTDGNTQ
uniref:Ig-like domain-containing protein n=1 Tax=Salmo trutta TaxID=8032 RepID=A0A674DT10_SALTR